MRTSGSEGGRRKPTRENAGRAPPADPTPACRPGRGSAARPSSRGLYAPAASSAGPPARARGADNAVGALEQAIRRRKHRDGGDPRGPGPPQRPRIQVTCPSPTPDDSSTRASRHRPEPWAPPTQAPPPRPRASPTSAGPVLARRPLEGPRRPRDRHRPVGELVQPHPTPPRQPRRPLTRRRRTPLPSQPHHHHRRPARHGITNPATA